MVDAERQELIRADHWPTPVHLMLGLLYRRGDWWTATSMTNLQATEVSPRLKTLTITTPHGDCRPLHLLEFGTDNTW
jgi:hypothetical protein